MPPGGRYLLRMKEAFNSDHSPISHPYIERSLRTIVYRVGDGKVTSITLQECRVSFLFFFFFVTVI